LALFAADGPPAVKVSYAAAREGARLCGSVALPGGANHGLTRRDLPNDIAEVVCDQ